MWGITINGKHTHGALGLKCTLYSLSAPEAVTAYITVPGMDGEYDATEAAYGRVTYKPRTLHGVFECFERTEEAHDARATSLYAQFSGRRVEIVPDSDAAHYLLGRIALTDKHEGAFGIYDITVRCDPYRYKAALTVHRFTVDGALQVTLQNAQQPVSPMFFTDSTSIEVEFGNTRYRLVPGGVEIPEIVLQPGANTLKLYGTGAVTIEYREGEL